MTDEAVQDESWRRIARVLSGEATPEEDAQFQRWLAEDPARAELVARLGEAVDRAGFIPPAALDVEAALARVHERMAADQVRPVGSAPSLRVRRSPWQSPLLLRAAAVVVVLLGATVLYRLLRPGSQPAFGPVAARTYQTPVGRADTLQLGDGSTVVLAPASRLVLGADFDVRDRRVTLEGVAWFKVRHDAARQFAVAAGDALVTDLGTAFTVRADPAQPVRVAVTEGAVRLASNIAAAPGVILVAGESGTVSGGVAAGTGRDTAGAALAWMRGRLLFADASFAQVAAELHRWYGVRLVAGDSAVAARHLTSEFNGETVQDVIAVIALALDARAMAHGDTIVLRSVP